MTWQTPLFLIVAGIAFGYSAIKFKTLFQLMKSHQGKGPTWLEIQKDLKARVFTTIDNVFFQKAVFKKRTIGALHAMIFWGFIVITIGTVEQFLSTLHTSLNFEFIGESAYRVLVYVQDVLTLGVILAVLGAAFRRFVVKPKNLGQSTDANLVLVFTGSLMLAILLMNAFYILGKAPFYQDAQPVSMAIAHWFATFNLSVETYYQAGTFFKWVHMLLVLGFTMYIPNSKHLHILAAGPNTFLKNIPAEKPMKPIDFTNESLTQYGAAKISDFSWKDALDYYSCTECGRCQEVCPAYNTGKPLSPKKLILDLKHNLYGNKPALLSKKYDDVTPAADGESITQDVLFACTSCRACEVACPVFINHTDKIYEMRRNLVMMESQFPAEVQTVFKNLETNASPWAFAAADRSEWAKDLDVKTVQNQPEFDVLLWVGCAGSFDDRNKKVLRSFVNVLNKAQVKFSILGNEEQCTGDAARRIGNEYLFQTLAAANVETLNRHQVKKIITSCPHCFNTLKNEYKDFGGHYEVIHHSQFIAQLISSGKLKPSKKVAEKITFHDSCYMGRWNNVYEQPRDVLKSLPGSHLIEMSSSKDKSMCCGAGGGRMWMEETIGDRVNVKRTEQALETGANIIASSCPFCITMISDGVKSKEKTDSVTVMDLAELIDQSTV